ncbi:MAG: DNA repair protein RecO [Desulfofustis sp.]
MPVIRSDLPALVVDSRDYGESDKIVTFFCQKIGKMGALARGAHRSKKRFLNKLEIFSFVQISYSQSSAGSLAILSEAELLNSFISLRTKLEGYQAASIIREYLLLSTSETAADDHLFQLALWALHTLNTSDNQKRTRARFMVKFFDVLGYRPDFSTCRLCMTRPPADQPVAFDMHSGGMTCRKCSSNADRANLMAAGTSQMISAVQQQPIARLNRFKPSGIIVEQMLDYAHRYSRHLFQRDIHSWKWLVG